MQKNTEKSTDALPRSLWVLLLAVIALCAAASVIIGVIGARQNAIPTEPAAPKAEETAFPADYRRNPNGFSYENADIDAYIRLGEYKNLTVTLTVGSAVTDADVRAAVNAALAAATTGDTSPAYDDAYVQSLGYADKAAYEAAVREELIASRPAAIRKEKETAALCAAVENATVLAYPDGTVEDQMFTVISDLRTLAEQHGMTYEALVTQATGLSVVEYEADLRRNAEYSVKRELVLFAIAKAEGISFSDQDAESYLAGYDAVMEILVNNAEFVGVK